MTKPWAQMTPKERAAYMRSFIGKSQKAAKSLREVADATEDLGRAFARLTQAERDVILRHPAIQTPKKKW